MAKLTTIKKKGRTTTKGEYIGEMFLCGAHTPYDGAPYRFELNFNSAENGAKVTRTIELDREETIEMMRRVLVGFNGDDNLHGLIKETPRGEAILAVLQDSKSPDLSLARQDVLGNEAGKSKMFRFDARKMFPFASKERMTD